MNDKLRWGVLGVANIAVRQVIPAMQQGEWSQIAAIASRDFEKAQHAAQALGIAKAYGSYEELLADEDIEAVYNPLPNHLHVPWTIKAAEAGKHVLCEKPFVLDAALLRPSAGSIAFSQPIDQPWMPIVKPASSSSSGSKK